MLFTCPRARLQPPFHTSADMESMSVHWITQTKTVILQGQLSKKIKVNGPGHRLSTEALNHLSNTFSHKPRTRSKAMPETNPNPQNPVSCTRLPHELENRADELMQASPLLSNFLDSFLSCGLKIFLGLSFRWQHTCCNYSLLL